MRGLVGWVAIGAGAWGLVAAYWYGVFLFAVAGVTLCGFGFVVLFLGPDARGPA